MIPKNPASTPPIKIDKITRRRGDPDSFPHDQWVNKMVFKLLDDYIQDKDGYTKNRFLSERNSDRRHCGYYRAKYWDNLQNSGKDRKQEGIFNAEYGKAQKNEDPNQ